MKITFVITLIFWSFHAIAGKSCALHFLKNIDPHEFNQAIENIPELSSELRIQLLRIEDSAKILAFAIHKIKPSLTLEAIIQQIRINPTLYTRQGQIRPLKAILNLMVDSQYAERSLQRRSEFLTHITENSARPITFPNFPEGYTPTREQSSLHAAFNRILELFTDRQYSFDLMQEIEDSVVLKSFLENPEFEQLTTEARAVIQEASLIDTLQEREIYHGMVGRNGRNAEYNVRLINSSQRTENWFNMLRRGQLFHDEVFRELSSAHLLTRQNAYTHGVYTHRIQWQLVLMDIEHNPQYYYGLRGVEIYQGMGNVELNKILKLDGANIWDQLMDSNLNNATFLSPEDFHAAYYFWPGIGGWP